MAKNKSQKSPAKHKQKRGRSKPPTKPKKNRKEPEKD